MSHYVTNLMALAPYKSPESPLNRSRSSSCSSPIRNRIVFQEIYSVGANTLFRSYSCDQVFDKDATGRTFQTTQIQISSFITPEKKFNRNQLTGSPRKNIQKTPRKLNVDLSEDTTTKQTEESEEKPQKPSDTGKSIMGTTIKYSFLPILTACLFYFYITYRECGYVWDLEKTENELKENVFGQDEALRRINSVLKMCNNAEDMYVMVFTGGVGVGKTFSTSIIGRNFPWSSNRLITYSESFNIDIEKLLTSDLSGCGYNLLVIDDLSAETTAEGINLIKLMNIRRKKNEKLLIIAVFHVHSESERTTVINDFNNSFINFFHIPFKHLTQDVVEKCFYTEIQRQGIQISNLEFDKLVREKMKHIDVVKGPAGCKGVADEVSSYYKNNYSRL